MEVSKIWIKKCSGFFKGLHTARSEYASYNIRGVEFVSQSGDYGWIRVFQFPNGHGEECFRAGL